MAGDIKIVAPEDPVELAKWVLNQLSDKELADRYHCKGDGSEDRCRTEQRLWYVCKQVAYRLMMTAAWAEHERQKDAGR